MLLNKSSHYDYIVVGTGVMGASTAYFLSKEKKKVLLIDQYAVKNKLNSSQDYSRSFRLHYGDDVFLTDLAAQSFKLWMQLEQELNKQFYFQTGKLLIGKKQHAPYALESYITMKNLGYPITYLNEEELQERFPQFDAEVGVLDHYGGVLDASNFVISLVKAAQQNGVELKENTKVNEIKNGKVFLENGAKLTAEKVIVTAGAWVNKLISTPVKPTKQQLLYFQPDNMHAFKKQNFPVFSYMEKGYYGLPIHGLNAVKFSNHIPGETDNPDFSDRQISKIFIEESRDFLADYLPSLASAKIVASKVCFYSTTPDRDFILDKIDDKLIIGGGFSGHGFKFSPVIGKLLAELAISGENKQDLNRLKLNRFELVGEDFREPLLSK